MIDIDQWINNLLIELDGMTCMNQRPCIWDTVWSSWHIFICKIICSYSKLAYDTLLLKINYFHSDSVKGDARDGRVFSLNLTPTTLALPQFEHIMVLKIDFSILYYCCWNWIYCSNLYKWVIMMMIIIIIFWVQVNKIILKDVDKILESRWNT